MSATRSNTRGPAACALAAPGAEVHGVDARERGRRLERAAHEVLRGVLGHAQARDRGADPRAAADRDRAHHAQEVAERRPHRRRPRRRVLDQVAVFGAREHGHGVDVVQREVAVLGSRAVHVATAAVEAVHGHALGYVLERMPLLVFHFTRPIDVVPQGEEGGAGEGHERILPAGTLVRHCPRRQASG
jgi:hypothetical protein